VDRLNREIKRMRDGSMAPVQTNLNEVLSSASLLQVDGGDGHLRDFFLKRHFKFADEYNKYNLISLSLINFGTLLTYYISFVFSLMASVLILSADVVEPEVSSLAFTYCFLAPYFLGIVSQLAVMTNHSFTSLERLLELRSVRVPSEAWPAGQVFSDPSQYKPGWPTSGQLSFRGVSLRYRPGLPLVIRQLNCHISAGERIGIVGRTGSGKSSLTILLFRIVEPVEGVISIDGVDISKVGLHELRSAIGMIPQTPVLFKGDVRENLDPFGEHDDDTVLLKALHQAELKNVSLDSQVGSDGSGLSAGQCQLVSFARILLRKTRMVVLDEPTASVDLATDAKMQTLVRTAFAGQTLLCIAHRLQTVIDFDRMLVMDSGDIVDFAPPAQLLADRSSALSRIVDAGDGVLRRELETIVHGGEGLAEA